jgi:drug/metabolite transporter (DMT)-like permease
LSFDASAANQSDGNAVQSLYNRPALLLSLTALFWAGNFVVGRAVAPSIPPATLACLRWMLAFLILLPFAWPYLRREMPVAIEHWKMIALLGLLGPASFNTLAYAGLAHTDALNGLVVNAAGPMFIAAAAFLIFGDRLTVFQFAGLILGLIGVLLVLTHGQPNRLAELRLNTGDVLLLSAISVWGVYTAFLRKRPALSWQAFCALTFAVGAVANIPLALMEHAAGQGFAFDVANLAAIGYVAIFPSLIAYIFYNRGVELIGAARAGMYLFLIPAFGAILAMVFLGEELRLFHLIAVMLIIAGVRIGTQTA